MTSNYKIHILGALQSGKMHEDETSVNECTGVTCSNSLPLYPDTGPFLM